MPNNLSKLVRMWLLAVPTIAVLQLEPHGPLMCERECKKKAGCKSFLFNSSVLSCTLKCNLCLTERPGLDMLCFNISKNNIGSPGEGIKTGKIYPTKSLLCDEVNTTSKWPRNRIIFLCLRSMSFHIIDSSNTSRRFEINYGRKILKISDFTHTKVLLNIRRENTYVLIWYDIEDKTEETVIDNANILDTSRGESEGVVYALGMRGRRRGRALWKISPTMQTEMINITGVKGSTLAVDIREMIFYFSHFRKKYIDVYNMRENSVYQIWLRQLVLTIAIEGVTNYLYIFSTKGCYRFILPDREIKQLPDLGYVMRALFYGGDIFYSVQRHSVYTLYKRNWNLNEWNMTYRMFIFKSKATIIMA